MEFVVTVNGREYVYLSRLVDTYYGPETRVDFYDDQGNGFSTLQEPMTTKSIVQMFVEMMTEHECVG